MPTPLTPFRAPLVSVPAHGRHHADAAAGNAAATTAAIAALEQALSGRADHERILLKAAAGAGKSHALKRMVVAALKHPSCGRVGVTAFANKQILPLAEDLGRELGKARVCVRISKDWAHDVPASVRKAVTVAAANQDVPSDAAVVIATSHMFGYVGNQLTGSMGAARSDALFDVLFVDEAWQLPLHRYRAVERCGAITVGVGDVGQLPPLDPGENPWRGDRVYNPYRAWPTVYDTDRLTWSVDLPAVWRPTQAQLALWQAFYQEWDDLTCVAGPDDRRIAFHGPLPTSKPLWEQVATGVPTLVEVDGLDDPDAADIDPPLLAVVERWLGELLGAGFTLHEKAYGDDGAPRGNVKTTTSDPKGQPLIAVLATRNQAVDDAEEMVERLTAKHDLPAGAVVASTVDSWQGQTNGLTVAIHPLSGAADLDQFNSAFGRLAVTCTRATHGLLIVSRGGIDDLLASAPARPGTPLGEPGVRQLPRQTHQRILGTFARGRFAA